MLRIRSWDEITCEWADQELDLPAGCTDPAAINQALNQLVGEDTDEQDGWRVEDAHTIGRCKNQIGLPSALAIICRSDRDHQGIIMVNYEQQEARS